MPVGDLQKPSQLVAAAAKSIANCVSLYQILVANVNTNGDGWWCGQSLKNINVCFLYRRTYPTHLPVKYPAI
jgi:hypothetical protein